jgi:hypothetical protein
MIATQAWRTLDPAAVLATADALRGDWQRLAAMARPNEATTEQACILGTFPILREEEKETFGRFRSRGLIGHRPSGRNSTLLDFTSEADMLGHTHRKRMRHEHNRDSPIVSNARTGD